MAWTGRRVRAGAEERARRRTLVLAVAIGVVSAAFAVRGARHAFWPDVVLFLALSAVMACLVVSIARRRP